MSPAEGLHFSALVLTYSLTAQRVTKCGITPKNIRAVRSFIEIPFSLEYQTLNLRIMGLSPTLDEVLFAGILPFYVHVLNETPQVLMQRQLQ